MPNGNRVEELESRVQRLEATVNGLTDELVETKERLEALEEVVDPDLDVIVKEKYSEPDDERVERAVEAAERRVEADNAEEDREDDNEAVPDLGDDIIVA